MSDLLDGLDVGSVIRATFTPKHHDTLRPEDVPLIGRRTEWSLAWAITAEDNEHYAGQFAWMLCVQPDPDHWLGWVPTEDLTDIEVVTL